MKKRRILIVGGVAGGASAAARLRRLCEDCEIVIFERGAYVSFANCGLPYYIGDVIPEESDLLLASPKLFRERFNIDVRLHNEVLAIHREQHAITVMDRTTQQTYTEPYDALILSPGASPLRPRLPGIDLPGVFALRTIPDSQQIRAWIQEKQAKRAVIIGAGFIGLEMAENLHHRGLSVTMVEMAPHVLPILDDDVAYYAEQHLLAHGVRLHLGDGLTGLSHDEHQTLVVHTQKGLRIEADIVILAVGVRPETTLARDAGLQLGERGGIHVDEHMQTSDPQIWAVGDAVEVQDTLHRSALLMPLAGPANRQGRIAADHIMGRSSTFRGVQATAICGIFDLTVATTGCSENILRKMGHAHYEKIYLHPSHHVGYYPGAKPIHIKLLFDTNDGRILGAQAIGEAGVDRRIDVLAMAIQMNATVFDLEESELCYAPQYGAAKDPINLAGMIASNVLKKDLPLAHWDQLESNALLLDVREMHEKTDAFCPDALQIPLSQLRQRIHEIPKHQPIRTFCKYGQRGYYATRVLLQHGLDAANLSGGLLSFHATHSRLHRT